MANGRYTRPYPYRTTPFTSLGGMGSGFLQGYLSAEERSRRRLMADAELQLQYQDAERRWAAERRLAEQAKQTQVLQQIQLMAQLAALNPETRKGIQRSSAGRQAGVGDLELPESRAQRLARLAELSFMETEPTIAPEDEALYNMVKTSPVEHRRLWAAGTPNLAAPRTERRLSPVEQQLLMAFGGVPGAPQEDVDRAKANMKWYFSLYQQRNPLSNFLGFPGESDVPMPGGAGPAQAAPSPLAAGGQYDDAKTAYKNTIAAAEKATTEDQLIRLRRVAEEQLWALKNAAEMTPEVDANRVYGAGLKVFQETFVNRPKGQRPSAGLPPQGAPYQLPPEVLEGAAAPSSPGVIPGQQVPIGDPQAMFEMLQRPAGPGVLRSVDEAAMAARQRALEEEMRRRGGAMFGPGMAAGRGYGVR